MLNIQKKIWVYWHQGWGFAPYIVKRCLESWKLHHKDWEIIACSRSDLKKYIDLNALIPNLASKDIRIFALSDIARITLLKNYGGVWVDATCFSSKSLNLWLPEHLNSGFFADISS